ncbi:MAG: phage tail sheath subtilisin-like domain-containing protein [Minicystis sp.]
MEFNTGVPAFLGAVVSLPSSLAVDAGLYRIEATSFTQLEQQEQKSGVAWASGHLGAAVRGFFQNGGQLCYVVHLADPSVLPSALAVLEPSSDFDLVCAPGLATLDSAELSAAQARILAFCADRGDCLAILDSARNNLVDKSALIQAAKAHRAALESAITALATASSRSPEELRIHGAAYFPWIKVPGPGANAGSVLVPPCGHIAGIYARTDRSRGFHKAPANEVVEGVIDLQVSISAADQEGFMSTGVSNLDCLRAFPGRGIRVWGARTLSLGQDWLYVNVRRTVMTVHRWLEIAMTDFLFEPNDPRLWIRIHREVSAFLNELHRRGALQGATAADAYFVKCDAENNPPAVREAGQVVTEIGLAPSSPREFLVVRLVHSQGGIVSVTASPGAL